MGFRCHDIEASYADTVAGYVAQLAASDLLRAAAIVHPADRAAQERWLRERADECHPGHPLHSRYAAALRALTHGS